MEKKESLGLAGIFLKNQLTACLSIAFFAFLGFYLQPFFIIGGAGISLIVMSYGLSRAKLLVLMTALITYGLSYIHQGSFITANLMLLIYILPLVVFSILLNRVNSQGITMTFVTIFALIVTLIARFYLDQQPDAYWSDQLLSIIKRSKVELGEQDITTLTQMAKTFSQVIVPVIGLSVFIMITCSLTVARYWQSKAFNPKAFGEEFRLFSVGKKIAILSTMIFVAVWFEFKWAQDSYIIFLFLLSMQGLSILHYASLVKKWRKQVLLLIYLGTMILLPLLLGSQVWGLTLVILATMGWLDNWINSRKKIQLTST